MDCCDSIEDLGCYQSCDIVEIGVTAAQTGLYTIEIQPSGTQIFQTTNTMGTPLVFSNGFNEDGVSVFKIKQPDGTYLTVNGSECFQIQNSVAKNPILADIDIIPVECIDATVRNSNNTFSQSIASGATYTLVDQTVNVLIDSVLASSTTYPAMTNPTINIVWT